MGNFFLFLAAIMVIARHGISASSLRDVFVRYSDRRLSSIQSEYIDNTTVEACVTVCVSQTDFTCKSFSYDNNKKSCSLYSVNLQDTDVHLIDSTGRDHYETVYVKLFNLLPKHRLPVATASRVEPASNEECARRCLLETNFNCRGFNYRRRQQLCQLHEMTSSSSNKAAMTSDDMDYYERQPEGSLESFINYGAGILRPLAEAAVYQRSTQGVTVEICAQQCIDETAFKCFSFDFIFDTNEEKSLCQLSKYIAANVRGLVADRDHPTHNHFERIERYLMYFYSTPYALLSGTSMKTYTKLTPNLCARMCLHDDSFVCRSFDYHMELEGSCVLSSKTASDIGSLNTALGIHSTSHHFEMKPILDCGGNLSDSDGGFASPNWPRNYAHHQHCVWNIQVPHNKVILLILTHFDVGPAQQSSDPCSSSSDRLVIEEPGTKPYCVVANTKRIITKTNQVTVTFYSNGEVDAQGFRAFYSAEWTCDVYLKSGPGEFASPGWPAPYPPGSRCSWRLTAPDGQRVRVDFTSFSLEPHTLGHCSDKYDNVRLLDGGTIGSPLIGLYCASHPSFSVWSSGRDMFVQFYADHEADDTAHGQGFHTSFQFELENASHVDNVDSRYVKLGDAKYTDWQGTELEDTRDLIGAHSSAVTNDVNTESDGGTDKSIIWGVITFLLLLVVALTVTLFLVIHHYRQLVAGHSEDVIEDGSGPIIEELQIHRIPRLGTTSRLQQQFNNILDLSAFNNTSAREPTTSDTTLGACSADLGAWSADRGACSTESPLQSPVCEPGPSCKLLNDSASNDPSPTPIPPPRPRSMYSKYHNDNVKNINIDHKQNKTNNQ